MSYLRARKAVNLRGRARVVVPAPNGTMQVTTRRVVSDRSGRSLIEVTSRDGRLLSASVEDGGWVRLYDAATQRVSVKRRLSAGTGESEVARRYRLVRRNYAVALREPAVLAGRRCRVVRFTPRHPGAHALSVWVDAATGAELGREESDRRGDTLSVMMFTSVEYPKRIAAQELRFTVPRAARVVNISRAPVLRDVSALRRSTGAPTVVPLTMPAGYQFEACTLTAISGVPTVVMRYSDGLTALTICQQPAPQGSRQGAGSFQAVAPGEGMVIRVGHDALYMIVGHVEPVVLYAVADGLDARREQATMTAIARDRGVSMASLRALRDRGLPLQEIVALVEASSQRNLSMGDGARLLQTGWDWRDLARRYGISERSVTVGAQQYLMRASLQR